MMISCHHCLCLLAVLPALCVASFTRTPHSLVVRGTRLAKTTYLRISEREEYDSYTPPSTGFTYRPGYGSHIWHHTSPSLHASKFTGAGVRDSGMVSAGKREDEQRDSGSVHAGVIPLLSQQPDGLGSSSAGAGAATALASTSTPASSALETTLASSFMSGSSSLHTQSPTEGQPTPSPSSASSLATISSASSSSSLQPALLALILVPVCIFLLGMMFALYRIYGKPGNRLPPVSPMFLGDSTARGSGYHRDEAIPVNSPTVQPRGSILSYDLNKKGTIKWEPQVERNSGPGIAKAKVLKGTFAACHFPEPPFPTTHTGGMRHHSPASRVLRPYVPRPYHRPRPGYTADPESVIPLIPNKANIKIKGGYMTSESKGKGKGKENVHEVQSHDARKHRDVMSTTPLNTSPRSLPFRDPVISAVFSDMEIRFQARSHPSSSSMVSTRKENRNQLDVPLSSAGTSFDIGLAMLSDFSSPNVGLGLDLSPRPPSPESISTRASQTGESLISGPMTEMSREAALPYLEHSVTTGGKALADQSGSSREPRLPDRQGELIDDELDIVSALAMYRTHHANDYNKTQVDRLDHKTEPQHTVTESQDTLAPSSSESSEAPYTSSSVKAPTLPTLSEMALSRADPLYESVTNELFSSYGMRMSTASGLGRPSRVSARISRMLSWFADSGNSDNKTSVMDNRMSCENPEVPGDEHGEGLFDLRSPGVQPLRIGKARKNAGSNVH